MSRNGVPTVLVVDDSAFMRKVVTELVDDGAAFERAMEWARTLAALEPAAVQLTKRALNQWLSLGVHTAFDTSLGYEMLTLYQPGTIDLIRSQLRSPKDAS